MSSKPTPLSSMGRRDWGEPLERDPDELTEHDWPPSPKKASKPKLAAKDSFTGAASSRLVNVVGGTGWTNSAAKLAKPFTTPSLTATPSFVASSKPKVPLASIFSRPSTSGASSSRSSAAPAASLPPKKRALPWDDLTPAPKSSIKPGSNFRNLGGGDSTNTANKRAMLTGDAMNIKQKVTLSPEQQMVLKLVVEDGKNVFFTGSAGTGKSVLLREIIAALKRKNKGRSDAVAVTASTGMAACNIGGTTIHSFSGIGLGIEAAEVLISKVRKNRVSSGKWNRTMILVIDEVSMVDGFLFDKLAAIACAIRKKPNFGGIQLVVTGDFFQLPPVTKGVVPTFAFEAKAWKNCIDHTVNLTQVFRQKDTEFIDMLNEMRFGTLTPASIAKFKALSREPKNDDGIDPTELFPMRADVEKANQSRLASLPGEARTFDAVDWSPPATYPGQKNTYLDSFMAQSKLVLKIGAQVMLIKNLDTTLVNGTVGKVIGFGVPELLEADSEDEGGGGRTAKQELAKDKRLAGIVQKVAAGGGEEAPIITWSTPAGPETKTMQKEEFKVEDVKSNPVAKRNQFPIILAWAMSIHKAQGQTIPRVKVNLGKVFEKGQSYVALSRATSLEGLQVIGFDASKVMAHPKVSAWSKTLTELSFVGR